MRSPSGPELEFSAHLCGSRNNAQRCSACLQHEELPARLTAVTVAQQNSGQSKQLWGCRISWSYLRLFIIIADTNQNIIRRLCLTINQLNAVRARLRVGVDGKMQ